MTDWANLRHAYGDATDVPALVRAAAGSTDESGAEWNELWGCLCHQGTVNTASYAAIPLLTEVALAHAPAGYIAALDLVACIVASNDGPAERVDARQLYARDLATLRELAERSLALATSDTEFIYGLQALLAFEDGGIWQRELNHLADGELPLECPHCGEYLLLDLQDPEFTVSSVSDASAQATAVRPGDPNANPVAARMLALTHLHGRDEVALRLPFVVGEATCPACTAAFAIPTAVS